MGVERPVLLCLQTMQVMDGEKCRVKGLEVLIRSNRYWSEDRINEIEEEKVSERRMFKLMLEEMQLFARSRELVVRWNEGENNWR